jgi:LPXTG-site transpeptidase (sortase) family protein
MRRKLGVVLTLSGVFALTVAATRYAQGALVADRARQAWDERTAHAAVAATRTYASDHGRALVSLGEPVAHLVIPKIGLDEIVLEGVGSEELNAAPGHLPASPLPGQRGNAVISAHRDRHFRHFDHLDIGDTIATEWGGQSDRWVVVSIRVVEADAPAIARTADPTLTLTTCWPIRYVGTAPERLIVTAKPVVSESKAPLR